MKEQLDFTVIKMPFGPTDLLISGFELFAIVAGFLALTMAFVIMPKIFNLIDSAFGDPIERKKDEIRPMRIYRK